MAPTVPVACRKCQKAATSLVGGLCPVCYQGEATQPAANRYDARKQWKHLYNKSRWRNVVQPAVLRRDPICKVCNRRPSTVADHIRDHRGDEKLFWAMDNLIGKCKPCHDEKTGSQHGFKRQDNLPPVPTAVPEAGPLPTNVDFTKLLNLDPDKKKG